MDDWMEVLPNQTWVHSPTQSEATLLTPGFGEGKCSICCKAPSTGSSKENRQLMLRRPKLSNPFRVSLLKGR